jgi:predicted TIM-barrel fold metal-dependent hydrolase
VNGHGVAEQLPQGFIDVWAAVGSGAGPARGADPGEVVTDARAAGVSLTLVRSEGAEAVPALADAALLERCAVVEGVRPLSTLTPYLSGGSQRQIARAVDGGAAGFVLDGRWFDREGDSATLLLLGDLARSGLPLFVRVGARGQASIAARMTAGLGFPVVLTELAYHLGPEPLLAARSHAHVSVTTSHLNLYTQLERVCALLGPERVLLGSGAPHRSVLSAVVDVVESSLRPDEQRAVLAGNALRLLGGSPAVASELELPVRTTLPAGTIDAHCHTDVDLMDVELLEADGFAARQRSAGIERSLASSVVAITSDGPAGNRNLARVASAGHVDGYVVLDPADTPATWAEQLDLIGGRGIVGVKIHSQWSSTPTASRAMATLFDTLGARGLPVKIHPDGEGWAEALSTYAARHPRLRILIAHAGPGTPVPEVIAPATAHDNIFIELASSMGRPSTLRRIGAEVPREKVLFGSDAPLLSLGLALGTYRTAGLGPEDAPEVYVRNWRSFIG